jgi:hypothetical protein
LDFKRKTWANIMIRRRADLTLKKIMLTCRRTAQRRRIAPRGVVVENAFGGDGG